MALQVQVQVQVQVQLKKVVLPVIRAAGRRLFLRSFGSHTRCCSMHDNGNYSIWSKGAFGLKQGGSRSSALYAHVLPMSTLPETGRASIRPQAATVVGIRTGTRTRTISTATCSKSNTPHTHCDHIGNHKRYQTPCSMRKGVILSYNHNSSKKIFTGTSSFGLGGVTCFSTGTNTSQVRVDSSIPPMVRIFRDTTETQVLNVVFTQSKEENHAPHHHEQKYMKELSIDHEYETHAHLVQCISGEIERHYALDDDDDDSNDDGRDFDSSENAHKQQFVGGMGESDGGVWIVTDETCEELGDALDYWELIRGENSFQVHMLCDVMFSYCTIHIFVNFVHASHQYQHSYIHIHVRLLRLFY